MRPLVSSYRPLCRVSFPEFAGIQQYMQAFDLEAIALPEHLAGYLPAVTALCESAGVSRGQAFLTVDEKIVKAGMSQRRPGPHVDGCFMPEMGHWGHGGWNHTCNNVPVPRMSVIVAASVVGCRVWKGEFNAAPRNDGDLSHIAHLLDEGVQVPANVGYQLSPDCVHESAVFATDTQRQFMRIALPIH